MKFEKSDKNLKKLTSFYERLKEDGSVDEMEIELLKSYTNKFLQSVNDSVTPATPVVAPVIAPPMAKVDTKKPVVVEEKKEEAAPKAEEAPKAAKPAVEAKAKVSSVAFVSLFSIEEGSELSDKLAKTSIKDIGKSMSINEKIFTVKELFSGDRSSFDETIEKLNSFKSYEEASKFLSRVAETNEWLIPEKEKKVKTFLKLVQRKYV